MPHGNQQNGPAVIVADLVADMPDSSPRSSIAGGKADAATSHISRGVILNALHSGQLDDRAGKPVQLSALFTVDKQQAKEEEEPSFSNLSAGRKAAFALSFLPSVMFVLCFSVLLPCQQESLTHVCTAQRWVLTDNDTDPPRTLWAGSSVLAAESRGGKSILSGLNVSSGQVLWKSESVRSPLRFAECGRLDAEEICLLLDRDGLLHELNDTDGTVQSTWEMAEQGVPPSFPVVMRRGSVKAFGMAVLNTFIEFVYYGVTMSGTSVPYCEDVPARLTPWHKNNVTDLLLTCHHQGQEILMVIPETKWFTYHRKAEGDPLILLRKDSISGFVTSESGLIVWSGNEVLNFDHNATLLWTTALDQHSDTGRFLFHGKFNGHEQVALLSSNSSMSMQVSIVNVADGALLWKHSVPDFLLVDVVAVQGKSKDYLIALLKTNTEKSEDQEKNKQNSMDISLIQLDGKYVSHPLHQWNMPADKINETVLKVAWDGADKDLQLFLWFTPEERSSEMRAFSVSDWEEAADKGLCGGRS